MKRATCQLLLVIVLVALLTAPTLGQGAAPELVLGLRRDFGYGGFGEIQGTFSMTISGPENLTRVVFWMDDRTLGEVTAAPWQLRFLTDNFAPGSHTLTATGYTGSGQELRSNPITTRFLSSQDAGKATGKLVVTLLGGIFGLMALSALVSSLLFRRKGGAPAPGAPRNYGLGGGAVCSRCGRPFARHMWAPNMVMGKLERCPYCGKWGIVRAASRAELAAAEAAELEGVTSPGQAAAESGPDQLRRDVEDSRFQDQ
jgi:DNA-directed RNA polymerase subunit RPC12/RpoP